MGSSRGQGMWSSTAHTAQSTRLCPHKGAARAAFLTTRLAWHASPPSNATPPAVKPANLLLDRGGLLKIADLGVAGEALSDGPGAARQQVGVVQPRVLATTCATVC